MRLLIRWAALAISFWVATALIPGIDVTGGPGTYLWLTLAADQGNTEALLALAHLLDSDTSSMAFDCCLRAAESNLPEAMHRLAEKYERGEGVSKNNEKAFFWYLKSAQQGWLRSACAAGVMLLKGIGVVKDVSSSMLWLLKAAEAGDALAQWSLSTIYAGGAEGVTRDLKQAFVWCQRAADQGFVAAISNLGLLYALSGKPVQAVACWQKAADQKDPESLYNLALAYVNGEGVNQDVGRAFDLLLDAAQQGVAQAQSRLGLMYALGEGVAQDSIEAHKWFYIAASVGDSAAKSNLLRSKNVCSPLQVSEAERRAEHWKKQRY
jgi:TPR repeat protein